MTPLMFAIHLEREACVHVLLQYGVNPNRPGENGLTPLHLTTEMFSHASPIISMLVAAGAKINVLDKRGRTPLDLAEGEAASPIATIEALRAHGAKHAWELAPISSVSDN